MTSPLPFTLAGLLWLLNAGLWTYSLMSVSVVQALVAGVLCLCVAVLCFGPLRTWADPPMPRSRRRARA